MELILAFLAWIGLIEREKPAPPAPVVRAPPPAPVVEERPELGPPPNPLPAAQGCREALSKNWNLRNVPWRVDGRAIWGVAGLASLREAWGDALIVVEGGNFSDGPFRGRRLRNFCFFGSDFTGSDWRQAETQGVGFIGADFSGAWLDRSRMRGLLLDSVKLDGATALGADWRGGVFQGGPMASMNRVRLDGADLRGVRMKCDAGAGRCISRWGSVSLRGADLRGADVDTLRADVDWTGARLGGTRLNLHQLTEIGSTRRLGPLIVRQNEAMAQLSPMEYRWLRGHISRYDAPGTFLKGSRPAWLRPGATVLLAAPPIELDAAARSSPLYRRLLPLLVEGASSILLVEVRRGGRIDVAGSAVGGNGHMCSLGGRNLRYDRSSGWFVGEDQGAESFGAPPPGRPVPIVAFSADRADIYENGHPWGDKDWGFSHFGSCGARAGFNRMLRLPLSPAQARRLYRTWD